VLDEVMEKNMRLKSRHHHQRKPRRGRAEFWILYGLLMTKKTIVSDAVDFTRYISSCVTADDTPPHPHS
jgi:hypothetical protein